VGAVAEGKVAASARARKGAAEISEKDLFALAEWKMHDWYKVFGSF
jgi:hypothetical protein